jgi:hypothetical protein
MTHHTHILTALYPDDATAERAMERLRAAGLPDERMEMHHTEEGDIVPGQHASGGFFGAIGGLFAPASSTRSYQELAHHTVVVASGVPHDMASTVRGILKEDALEVDDGTERTREADDDPNQTRH